MTTERAAKAAILAHLCKRADVMAWNHPTGVVRIPGTRRVVAFGSPGSADIIGCVTQPCPTCGEPLGRFVGVEVKAAYGRPSAKQKAWGSRIVKLGGVYVIAKGVEDVSL